MDEDTSLFLTETALEAAVLSLLADFEAEVRVGPFGSHDLEVGFPEGFRRAVGVGGKTILMPRKKFIVEVKSHAKRGAKLGDLRQLHDWVMRATNRTAEGLEDCLHNVREEFTRVEGEVDDLKSSFETGALDIGEFESVEWQLSQAEDAIRRAILDLTLSVKGILIVNHYSSTDLTVRGKVLDKPAHDYSLAHGLAVIAWPDLLKFHRRVLNGEADALNFWCAAFEASGLLRSFDFNWQRHSRFFYRLMPTEEANVDIDQGPKFLNALWQRG